MRIPDQVPELKPGDDAQVIFERINMLCAAVDALWRMKAGPGIKITKSEANMVIESTIPLPSKNG